MQEKIGKPEEAARSFELASGLPDDMGVFSIFKMGTLYLASGDEAKAREALTRFLSKWKGNVKTRTQAEQLLARLQDH